MKTLLFSVFALSVLAVSVILRLRSARDHHPNAELMIEAVESIDAEEEEDADTADYDMSMFVKT
jgi:hypothetical protein